ncbi:MAG: acylphosphatase [Nitrososphaera sp.]
MKTRAHVFVSGKVQGVYFRQNTLQTANSYGVFGWVRNLPDGRVEAIFEGEEEAVNKVVEWCRAGPSAARVDSLDVKNEKYTGEFSSFAIV